MQKKLPLLLTVLLIAQSLCAQTLVKDILSGSDGSSPRIAGKLPGGFVFYANSPGMGKEPWFSDGTEQGTVLLKDIQTGTGNSDFPTYFTRVGDDLFFVAKHMGSFNISLWKTDGTPGGTVMVKDLGVYNIQQGGGGISAMHMAEFNGNLYFSYDGGEGVELWKSDGTANGTALLKDINGSFGQGSNPIAYTVFGQHLYFFANNGSNGNELWKTDGTTNGTTMVKDLYQGALSAFNAGTPSLFVFKNKLYFGAQGDHDEGVELFVSDGTSNGTVLFKDIHTDIEGGSYPAFIDAAADYFIFRATSVAEGIETWVSDGTPNGTKLLKDISPGTGAAYPGACAVLGNSIVFYVYTTDNGSELWVTDGTTTGTKLLKDIYPGNQSGYAGEAVKIGNKLYFLGNTADKGTEIWETDGSENGTVLQLETNPGTAGSGILYMLEMDGKLFFNAGIISDAKGNELYMHTPQPLTAVQTLYAPGIMAYPNPLRSGENLSMLGLESITGSTIQIYNQSAQKIFECLITGNTMELPAHLPSGFYTLHIVGMKGQHTIKLQIE